MKPIYLEEITHRNAKQSAALHGESLREFATAAVTRELMHRAHKAERNYRRKKRMEKEGRE